MSVEHVACESSNNATAARCIDGSGQCEHAGTLTRFHCDELLGVASFAVFFCAGGQSASFVCSLFVLSQLGLV